MRNLNKPNRYNVASIQAQQTLGGDVMESAEEGQYVAWRDYAWLLAEVERLRASSFVTAVPVEQYERVIKAGSEMSAEMRFAWLERIRTNKEQREAWLKKVHQCLIDWENAKEGKHS